MPTAPIVSTSELVVQFAMKFRPVTETIGFISRKIDVIGRVVPLRRSGKNHIGLCPFHQEKTPSFQVDAENQLYYCFGCSSGGDVLSFVMKHQNLAFGDAVKYISERYNIPLPEGDRGRADDLLAASQQERAQILGRSRLRCRVFLQSAAL